MSVADLGLCSLNAEFSHDVTYFSLGLLQHGEVIHTTYNALMEKIETYQPSPTAPVEQIDSPLMSVPAPHTRTSYDVKVI